MGGRAADPTIPVAGRGRWRAGISFQACIHSDPGVRVWVFEGGWEEGGWAFPPEGEPWVKSGHRKPGGKNRSRGCWRIGCGLGAWVDPWGESCIDEKSGEVELGPRRNAPSGVTKSTKGDPQAIKTKI